MKVRVGVTVLAAVLLTSLGLAVVPAAAQANPWGGMDCEQFPDHADCQTEAGTPGRSGWVSQPTGEVVCRNDRDEVVDCYIEGEGWIGADGCRYLRTTSDQPPEGTTAPGAWHFRQCSNPPGGSVIWLTDSEAPGPALLAQIVVSRLSLPPPELEMSPPRPGPQLVMLPTWLWVSPQWWGTRSASASVPEMTVTAVATPVQVQWETGDGRQLTCGSGTPYGEADDPASASPDCGHTYTRTSKHEPGGAFELTATVTWQVTWTGGGTSGTVGPLFSTATVPVEVVESLSRNTRSPL